MYATDRIGNIEQIRSKLPETYRHWHCFSSISELCYQKQHDYLYDREVVTMKLLLNDLARQYQIRLTLYDISGTISFDMCNGFCSGLQIEDLYQPGYERGRHFRLSGIEQDVSFTLYCESIHAEWVE